MRWLKAVGLAIIIGVIVVLISQSFMYFSALNAIATIIAVWVLWFVGTILILRYTTFKIKKRSKNDIC